MSANRRLILKIGAVLKSMGCFCIVFSLWDGDLTFNIEDLMIERGTPINHWRRLSTRCYESSEILPFGPALRYLRALG